VGVGVPDVDRHAVAGLAVVLGISYVDRELQRHTILLGARGGSRVLGVGADVRASQHGVDPVGAFGQLGSELRGCGGRLRGRGAEQAA
jgi:hypothetical protein